MTERELDEIKRVMQDRIREALTMALSSKRASTRKTAWRVVAISTLEVAMLFPAIAD